MASPPLPDVPCVRVGLDYSDSASKFGSRFYLSYTGGPLSGDDCAALAATVATQWGATVASQIASAYSLVGVDVLDIATHSGLSGQDTTVHAGGNTGGSAVPVQCAINVEFGIGRRYRGGKPRMYFPPAPSTAMADPSHWVSGLVTSMNGEIGDFFTAVLAGAPAAGAPWKHVSLSFYAGSTGVIYDAGHEGRTDETYRATALHDDITGYSTKAVIGSQRRRRLATS